MKLIHIIYLILNCRIFSALDGQNICSDITSKKEFCCSDYEEINGTCVECNIGFFSRDGSPCSPCNRNFYGVRCLLNCNCSLFERCDHILGCQKIHTVDGLTVSTLQNFTDTTIKTKESQDGHQIFSKKDFVLYSVGTTCVILTVCLIYHVRQKRRLRQFITTGSEREAETSNPEIDNTVSHVYHSIDESAIIPEQFEIPSDQPNFFLEEVESRSSGSLSHQEEDSNMYRHQYHGHNLQYQTTALPCHRKEESNRACAIPVMETSCSSDSSSDITDEDREHSSYYSNIYQTLENNCDKKHEYDIPYTQPTVLGDPTMEEMTENEHERPPSTQDFDEAHVHG